MPVIWKNGMTGVRAPVKKKAPGDMTVKELKAELDVRKVGYIASAKKAELLVMVEDELFARENKD